MRPSPTPRGALADDPWITWVLDAARAKLRTDVAWVSEFTGGAQVVRAATGDLAAMNVSIGMSADLEGSFCVRVLSGQLPPVVTAAGRDSRTRDLPVTTRLRIGSYVGAPLRGADGRPIGMLCCLSRDDGTDLDRESVAFVEFLADLIGNHLRSSSGPAGSMPDPRAQRVLDVLRHRRIEPVFQPVINMRTGGVVAYEALARFPETDTATLFSDASATGRGLDLELLAADAALAAARNRPHDVMVALNLSAEALVRPEFLDLLLGHGHERIAVEITEHAPVIDYPALLVVRETLRNAGIMVSVDDAGSGYASLRHVLQLRPDIIKMDAALISGVHVDPAKQALVVAMLSFARSTGATLVAEGVEVAAERDVLVRDGVIYGQGWLYGRPGPFAVPVPVALTRVRTASRLHPVGVA